jgi:hypothetical protein
MTQRHYHTKLKSARNEPSLVELVVSAVNECQLFSVSVTNLSATTNHLSDVHAPLDRMHSPDPILGAAEQYALEVAVVLTAEKVMVQDDADECLDATFPW